MTGWFTAGPSKKRKPSRPIFKLASQSVAWNCTLRKPRRRKEKYPNVKFDFLGYGFRPRWVKNSRSNELFCEFTPAVRTFSDIDDIGGEARRSGIFETAHSRGG
jgi:hypothetical protein